MDNMYYGDYYNTGFSYELYPVNKNQNQYCDSYHRNNSLSSNSSSYNDSRIDNFFNVNEGFSKGNMQANIYRPYKLTNPSLPVAETDKERLLLDVQKYSFAMWDLNLYLNTHPTDKNVMMLFDQYRTAYKKAANDYENKYGSLHVVNTNVNSSYWDWNKCPWPWEGE